MKKETIIKAEEIITAESSNDRVCFMLIRQGLIIDISEQMPDATGADLFDLSGLVISPFFCDYHLHLPDETDDNVAGIFSRFQQYGINGVYDAGNRSGSGALVRAGMDFGCSVKTAVTGIFRKGGYGGHIGKPVSTVREAMEMIDSLCERKADYIKVINSGIYEPDQDRITAGGFGEEEIREIISYSGSKGLPVYCHANGDRAISEATAAGASAIIHGLGAEDKTLEMMADRGTALIPTISAFRGIRSDSGTEAAERNVERVVRMHMKNVLKAHEMGVKVLAGSDASPGYMLYGSSYREELGLLHEAGMPYASVLQSASSVPLCIGASADFLVLDGLDIRFRMIQGEIISQSDEVSSP